MTSADANEEDWHGTRTAWESGCRCEKCARAYAAYIVKCRRIGKSGQPRVKCAVTEDMLEV